jgi:hypothetical protein
MHDFYIGKQAESETYSGSETPNSRILRAFGWVSSNYP